MMTNVLQLTQAQVRIDLLEGKENLKYPPDPRANYEELIEAPREYYDLKYVQARRFYIYEDLTSRLDAIKYFMTESLCSLKLALD